MGSKQETLLWSIPVVAKPARVDGLTDSARLALQSYKRSRDTLDHSIYAIHIVQVQLLCATARVHVLLVTVLAMCVLKSCIVLQHPHAGLVASGEYSLSPWACKLHLVTAPCSHLSHAALIDCT